MGKPRRKSVPVFSLVARGTGDVAIPPDETLQKFASVYAQHAEAILGIMEGDALDGTGNVLALYRRARGAGSVVLNEIERRQ